MKKFLNIVRSNNLVQAMLCIVFGLFLMLRPSITVRGIIMLFAVALALTGVGSLVSYSRQKSLRYRDAGVLVTGVVFLVAAILAWLFPQVIAGFFSIILGFVLMLCAAVNAVRAFIMRAYGGGVWIGVLVASLLVGAGGVLVVANPFGASMLFVLVLGSVFVVNGVVALFIEWYTRDYEKRTGIVR